MYFDRIRRGDGQEKERRSQAEIEEDAGPTGRGPPKEDPPSRSLFRMVPRRCDETDHEHRRCLPFRLRELLRLRDLRASPPSEVKPGPTVRERRQHVVGGYVAAIPDAIHVPAVRG